MLCLKAASYKLHELKMVRDYTLFSSISDLFFLFSSACSPIPSQSLSPYSPFLLQVDLR